MTNIRSVWKGVVSLILALLCGNLAFAQSFTVSAPNVVEINEIFKVVYTADADVESFTAPTVTGMDLLAGPTTSRMSSTQIVNGKRTDSYQVSYTLVLRATSKGIARLSEASATINGKSYKANGVEIEVVENNIGSSSANSHPGAAAAGSQSGGTTQNRGSNGTISSEDIFLTLTFSKTNVVKGEPIVATLKLYTKVPIAGFEDVKFPVFNGFWSQELESVQNINFVRENYKNQIYSTAVIRKYMLLPQQTGEITVDPAEMICLIQIRTAPGGRSMFDDFFDTYQTVKKRLNTPKATINVKALPEGAPASFGGGVGEFSMSVRLGADSLKAHEAGSLTVEISGRGNLNLIETPKVELPADFEAYDVKSNNNFTNGAGGMSGKKVFEYPFIPRSEGIFDVPPVVYSYYDISTGKYVTLKSDTLKIKVLASDKVQSGGGSLISGVNKQNVVNLGSDIRYIVTSSPRLVKSGSFFVGSVSFIIIVLIMIVLFFVLDKAISVRKRLKGDVKRTRNRRANKVARMRLKQAQIYLKENLSPPFYEELHKALLGYISDKLTIQFAQMQRENISEVLQDKGVDEKVVADFMELLENCEKARYSQSGGSVAMNEQYNRAIALISSLEERL